MVGFRVEAAGGCECESLLLRLGSDFLCDISEVKTVMMGASGARVS